MSARSPDVEIGGIVQRWQIVLGNGAEKPHGVPKVQRLRNALEVVAAVSDAGNRVARVRMRGPNGRQRAHDGVDPFVPFETRDGQQPRTTIQSVLRPNTSRINAWAEMRRRRAKGHGVDRNLQIEQSEHPLRELGGPRADGHDHRCIAQQALRGQLLETAASNFRLDQQQLGAIHDQAVGKTAPRREPARGVPRGLQFRAPGKARPPGRGERARAPRPQRESLHRSQPRGAHANAIDQLRKARVTRGAPFVRARGDDERALRIPECHFAHHAGDAAAVRRKIER